MNLSKKSLRNEDVFFGNFSLKTKSHQSNLRVESTTSPFSVSPVAILVTFNFTTVSQILGKGKGYLLLHKSPDPGFTELLVKLLKAAQECQTKAPWHLI